MPNKKTICLSAGGTGGHLFPAEALAEELIARGHKVVIITDKRGHAFKSLKDTPVHTVRAATLKGGIVSKIAALVSMGIGVVQAVLLLRKYKPAIVVGFGGYPSFPAVFAAQLLGIPTLLHEQNAVLGKANKFHAARARVIAASWPGTRGIGESKKTVVTGNPVRAPIIALKDGGWPTTGNCTVLVTGGSQGASILSRVVPSALAALPEQDRRRLHVFHQARDEDTGIAAGVYKAAGIEAEVAPFFSDMPQKLAASHLFIGRSGASTVAELAVAGRPAVFIPLSHADRQQHHNAQAIVDAGGAWLILQEDFTPKALADKMKAFLDNPAILSDAARKAKS